MATEIVSFPIKTVIFHNSYVTVLSEGNVRQPPVVKSAEKRPSEKIFTELQRSKPSDQSDF